MKIRYIANLKIEIEHDDKEHNKNELLPKNIIDSQILKELNKKLFKGLDSVNMIVDSKLMLEGEEINE